MADPDDSVLISTAPVESSSSLTGRPRKRYVLVDVSGKRLQKANVYTGKGPYQAAAKAARRLIEKRSRSDIEPAEPADAEIEFHVRAVNDHNVWSYVASGIELAPEKATYMRVETDESGKRKRKRISYDDYRELDDDARKRVACHRRKIMLKRINKPVSARAAKRQRDSADRTPGVVTE